MLLSRRAFLWLTLGLVSVVTLWFVALMPIYTDEIGWMMVDTRMLRDDGQALTSLLMPSCGAYSTPVSWLLAPFAAFDSLIYDRISDPLQIRLAGVAAGIAIVGLIGRELTATIRPARPGLLRLGVLSFAMLGVLPFLLAMSRPEQMLLPVITLLVIRGSGVGAGSVEPSKRDWLSAAVIVAASGMAMATHPKAIFFAPVFLLSLWALRLRRPAAVAAGAGVLVLAGAAYRDWIVRRNCPADPFVTASDAQRSLVMAITNGRVGEFLTGFLGQNPFNILYIRKILLRSYYTADWLPRAPAVDLVRDLMGYAIAAALGGIMVAGAVALGVRLIGLRRDPRDARAVLLVAALWISTLALSATQALRNDYEATLIVPALAVAALLSLWLARDWARARFGVRRLDAALRLGVVALCGLSIVSQGMTIATFAPYATRWAHPGYVDGQPYSISHFGYDRLRPQILAAADRCAIAPKGAAHLLVDELTYLALADSREPILTTYVDPGNWGRNIRDLPGLLAGLGSAGMVTACRTVPPDIGGGVIRVGEFCCHAAFAGDSRPPN